MRLRKPRRLKSIVVQFFPASLSILFCRIQPLFVLLQREQTHDETELTEKMGEMTIAPFTIPAGDPFDTTFCVSIPVQNKLNQRVLVRRNLNTVIIEFIIFFDF